MEQIVVQVQDKEKAKMLLDLPAALDFVASVKTGQTEAGEQDDPSDFFALAGIWRDRETTQESIRKEAWLRKKQQPGATSWNGLKS